MKKLPLLTAAAMAAGVAMLAPAEAKACDNCTDMNGDAMCKTEGGATFGACTVQPIYDCDGNQTGSDCQVWYDPNCANQSWWNGPVPFEDFNCVAFFCQGGGDGWGHHS
jgi:hypothetical protein